MQQIRVLTDELGTVKGELINMKVAHGTLHHRRINNPNGGADCRHHKQDAIIVNQWERLIK